MVNMETGLTLYSKLETCSMAHIIYTHFFIFLFLCNLQHEFCFLSGLSVHISFYSYFVDDLSQ